VPSPSLFDFAEASFTYVPVEHPSNGRDAHAIGWEFRIPACDDIVNGEISFMEVLTDKTKKRRIH